MSRSITGTGTGAVVAVAADDAASSVVAHDVPDGGLRRLPVTIPFLA